jgi:hypothetical protein
LNLCAARVNRIGLEKIVAPRKLARLFQRLFRACDFEACVNLFW